MQIKIKKRETKRKMKKEKQRKNIYSHISEKQEDKVMKGVKNMQETLKTMMKRATY